MPTRREFIAGSMAFVAGAADAANPFSKETETRKEGIIVISDAHFPGHTFNARTLRADGIGADRLLAGIIPLFELDAYATPVVMMAPVPGDSLDPSVEAKYRRALGYEGKIEQMERYAFYERAKKAYAVVISGETAKYGNIILKKGVTPVAP